jgi:uncharacterized protein
MRRFAITLFAVAAASAGHAQVPSASPVLGPGETLLAITAEGQSRQAPDLAMFAAGVVTQGVTAGDALTFNARKMDEVVRALKRVGVADRDIQTSTLSLQPQYSNPEQEAQLRARIAREPYIPPAQAQAPKIIGYEAQNTVNVRVSRLTEMGRIIDTLVTAGANQIDGPTFSLDQPMATLDEARVEAMQVARARAELYAKTAGLRVTRILSISEAGGYYPVQQVVMFSRSAGAPPPPPPPSPVAAGELTLGVNISVQFVLGK